MSVRKRLKPVNIVSEETNKPLPLGVTEDERKVIIDDFEVEESSVSSIASESKSDYSLPEKYIFNSKLDDMLPKHKEKRKVIKNNIALKYWDEKLNSCLALYDINSDKYNIKLVKACCQIVEKYMIYAPQLGETKKAVVKSACLRFFDNNEKLLDSVIEEVLESIDRSTVWMRVLAKIELFFFSKS